MSTDDTDRYKEAFSLVVRRKRNNLKITQEELADRAGVAVRYVGHLERATRQPTVGIFCDLSYALESTPSELMAELEVALEQGAGNAPAPTEKCVLSQDKSRT